MTRICGRVSRVRVPDCAKARVGCAALALLAGALLPSEAHAIPALPASWTLVNADLPVVEDGVLLFRFDPGDFNSGGGVALAPMVMTSTAAVVPGSVEMLDIATELAIYRFDAALGGGNTFTLSDATNSLYGTFTTTLPFVSAAPVATVGTTTGVQLETLEQACCSGTTLISPFGPTPPPCVVLRAAQHPQVFVSGTLPMNDSSTRQYVYRAVMTAPTEVAGPWRSASETTIGWSLATSDVAMEYCIRLEAYRLLDGESSVLDERCVPHDQGTFGEVGPDEASIAAALDVRGCLIPATQLEAAWCEVNRSACADPSSPSQSACVQASFDTTCADHAPSDASLTDLVEAGASGTGTAGSSGSAGSGAGGSGAGGSGSMLSAGAGADNGGRGGSGSAGDRAMIAGQDPANDSEQMNDSGSSGCTVAARAGGSPAAYWPWLAAAVVWAARRRRTRSRAATRNRPRPPCGQSRAVASLAGCTTSTTANRR